MSLVLRYAAMVTVVVGSFLPACFGAERPTFNHDTCDPRPDILPHPISNATTEYRQEYNRPRFWSGWIAHHIAPTSQEAMVWCENCQAGAYDEKHAPPRYKRYFAPKPWEVLQTGSRPDFPKPESLTPGIALPEYDEKPEAATTSRPRAIGNSERVATPLEQSSPSDN